MSSYNTAAQLPRDEQDLRALRALALGPSTARHLRLVADEIEDDGILELPGVDAERLRLLARKLDEQDAEIESLRGHADTLHRALCDAIDDLDALENEPITFVFVPVAFYIGPIILTPEQFSDLAVFILDEAE